MTPDLINECVLGIVLHDMRNGQWQRAFEMGFTEEHLRLLKNPANVRKLLYAPVRWVKVIVYTDLLDGLLKRADEIEKESVEIDQMLELGASGKMMAQVFGLTHQDIAFRKRLLLVPKKRGRWPEISEEQNHVLWREWKALIAQDRLDTFNPRGMAKACMKLAQKHKLPMAMIWQAIEDWLEITLPG